MAVHGAAIVGDRGRTLATRKHRSRGDPAFGTGFWEIDRVVFASVWRIARSRRVGRGDDHRVGLLAGDGDERGEFTQRANRRGPILSFYAARSNWTPWRWTTWFTDFDRFGVPALLWRRMRRERAARRRTLGTD